MSSFYPPWSRLASLLDILSHRVRLLPGDLLEDLLRGCIHLYVADTPLGLPIAPVKYRVVEEPTPWRMRHTGEWLQRVLGTYTPGSIASSAAATAHDPIFGVEVPTLNGELLIHYSSEEAFNEALHRPWCREAEVVARAVEEHGLPMRGVGLTGSLLLLAQHRSSDIDIVVHSYESSVSIIEHPVWEPLSRGELAAWAAREAAARGLEAGVLARIYRVWARGRYQGYTVSVSIQLPEEAWKEPLTYTGSRATCSARVEPLQRSVAAYPSVVEEFTGCGEYTSIIVLDGIYKPALLEGGVFEFSGLEASSSGAGRVLVVGDRREPGYVKQLYP